MSAGGASFSERSLEEIADVSLATFHVFDRETKSRLRQGLRLAAGVQGGCGITRGCGPGGCVALLARLWVAVRLMAVVRLVAVLMPVAVRAAAARSRWRLRWSWWWLCGSYGRLRWSWWWLRWSWLQRLRGSWLQRFRRLRLGRCVVRNCLLGQHRLHWKLLAMGPIPPSMDQRLLLMSLAPTIFEQWWCQVPIAGEHHCSKND